MSILIKSDDLSSGDVVELLEQHRLEMFRHSPPESVHALDVAAMRSPDVSFYSAWIDGCFAGCGALKELDSKNAEIKSMKTRDEFLRQGVARRLLDHLLQVAIDRGYHYVSLETGSVEAFRPALELYQRAGFVVCGPFADYQEDPHSVFMHKHLPGPKSAGQSN